MITVLSLSAVLIAAILLANMSGAVLAMKQQQSRIAVRSQSRPPRNAR